MSGAVLSFPEKEIRGWPMYDEGLRELLAHFPIDQAGIDSVVAECRVAFVEVMRVQLEPHACGDSAVAAYNQHLANVIAVLLRRLAASDAFIYHTLGHLPAHPRS